MTARSVVLTATLTAALALAIAGCRGETPADLSRSSATTRPTTAAGNRSAAEREAERLLALVPVPAGSTVLAAAPEGLADVPARPVVDSIAVRSRFWTVPLPYEQARAWIEAHPPEPLSWTSHGGSSGGGHAPTTDWATEQGASASWQEAQAEVSLVGAGGTTSRMRVDGVAVWLDPTPYPDDATVPGGRRVRLTLAAGCPASDRTVVGVTGDGPGQDAPGLDTQLLPGPQPTAGLVCRYSGLNGAKGKPPMALLASRTLDAAAARRLAADVLALPLAHPVGEVRSCPADDGSAVLVALAYPGRADADLRITTTGCRSVANGRIRAGAQSFLTITSELRFSL